MARIVLLAIFCLFQCGCSTNHLELKNESISVFDKEYFSGKSVTVKEAALKKIVDCGVNINLSIEEERKFSAIVLMPVYIRLCAIEYLKGNNLKAKIYCIKAGFWQINYAESLDDTDLEKAMSDFSFTPEECVDWVRKFDVDLITLLEEKKK